MKLYSGCGNTFIITKYDNKKDSPDIARSICKDKYDGFMMVKTNPLEMHLYNQDGSIASMCGNGIRCFINFCYEHKIITNDRNIVKTPSGMVETLIVSKDPFIVRVWMNDPKFIYLDNKIHIDEHIINNNHHYNISLVNTGVWHGIIIPDNFEEALIDAPSIRGMKEYQEFLNLDIVKTTPNIYVKTCERGIGFTKACGTGVMATYIILRKLGIINSDHIEVVVDGGIIKTGKDNMGYYIEGVANYVMTL